MNALYLTCLFFTPRLIQILFETSIVASSSSALVKPNITGNMAADWKQSFPLPQVADFHVALPNKGLHKYSRARQANRLVPCRLQDMCTKECRRNHPRNVLASGFARLYAMMPTEQE